MLYLAPCSAQALPRLDRCLRTLFNLAGMERFRGHFYNWYETLGPTPIPPFYVSTVDSGNLAGHLLALKQGCLELRDAPVFGARTLDGLRDTLDETRELRLVIGGDKRASGAPFSFGPLPSRAAIASDRNSPSSFREGGRWRT